VIQNSKTVIVSSVDMQRSLAQLTSLSPKELASFAADVGEPFLITDNDGEPRLVAQTMDAFEAMVRRLRALEARVPSTPQAPTTGCVVVPLRR